MEWIKKKDIGMFLSKGHLDFYIKGTSTVSQNIDQNHESPSRCENGCETKTGRTETGKQGVQCSFSPLDAAKAYTVGR